MVITVSVIAGCLGIYLGWVLNWPQRIAVSCFFVCAIFLGQHS